MVCETSPPFVSYYTLLAVTNAILTGCKMEVELSDRSPAIMDETPRVPIMRVPLSAPVHWARTRISVMTFQHQAPLNRRVTWASGPRGPCQTRRQWRPCFPSVGCTPLARLLANGRATEQRQAITESSCPRQNRKAHPAGASPAGMIQHLSIRNLLEKSPRQRSPKGLRCLLTILSAPAGGILTPAAKKS